MNEIIKELDHALAMLSSISCSGGVVDVMAAAKSKIRKAQEIAKGIENNNTKESKDG